MIIAVMVSKKYTHPIILSPELIRTANGLRATKLGVKVVVDSSHFSDSYPVLAFEWEPEWPPAQVRWYIQDEACHVGQLDAPHIPDARMAIFTFCKLPFCIDRGRFRISSGLQCVCVFQKTSCRNGCIILQFIIV